MIINTSLLSTAYFPSIEYFAIVANSKLVIIDGEEMYQKQTYRTRCHINSANGLLVLTIPVLRGLCESNEKIHKLPITEILIDYSKPWLLQHKRALEAAYKSSPFFEYYVDDIFQILDTKEPNLFSLNNKLFTKLLELIGIETPIKIITEKVLEKDIINLKDAIHPKKNPYILEELKLNKPYYQVFTNKQGFIQNLSILDLLFNEGPNSISYLELNSNRK